MKKFFQAKFFYPCLLTLIFIVLLTLTIPAGCIYGSEGDWFSQHVALAEQFRQIFYETGRIFPDYTNLGAGSNIYDISYYGFLRPDVLISFLLPKISMKYIISSYSILGMIAAINLCYLWLKQHVTTPFFAFLGALLFSCGGFSYQAHHQIMFVNYLPFLFLALMGIDRITKKQKNSLLTFSLFLLYLHSYYFSVAVLFVCLIYFLYSFSLSKDSLKSIQFRHLFKKFAESVLFSISMAAVLLLPTALDLLSTKKDAGTPSALNEIFNGSLAMDSLLYSGYSCGLTLLCLYTLLLSIRRKSTRLISILLLLCLTLNVIPYVLSGFLYIRYKVLIPIVPLLLLLCVQTLEELYHKQLRHCLPLLSCCMIPVFFHDSPNIILLDFLLMAISFFLCHLANLRTLPKTPIGYLLLAVLPLLVFLTVNQKETYIAANDNRQNYFSREELSTLSLNRNYRFDYLTAPSSSVNLTAPLGMGSTGLYSSVTNSGYADYFYNTMHQPIRIRNRVALISDANPFFSYLMGVRYIQTRPHYLPLGYEIIASDSSVPLKSHAVIAENPDVAPIAYTSTHLMGQTDYQNLKFPYNLMALTNYTITADGPPASNTKAEKQSQNYTPVKGITPLPVKQKSSYSFSAKKKSAVTVPLSDTFKNKILILSFDVSSRIGNEVTIDINGTRNKLSGKNAPYPNHNHRFTYILSSARGLNQLNITFSKGTYSISNISAYLAEPDCIGNNSIIPFSPDSHKGNAVLKGTARLTKDGYFVTSLPYRPGYQVYADGRKITPENINEGFVGFPLTAGTHEIIIFFSPPGKNAGIFLSLTSLILFLLTLEKEKRKIL